jgi:hypothetical protein
MGRDIFTDIKINEGLLALMGGVFIALIIYLIFTRGGKKRSYASLNKGYGIKHTETISLKYQREIASQIKEEEETDLIPLSALRSEFEGSMVMGILEGAGLDVYLITSNKEIPGEYQVFDDVLIYGWIVVSPGDLVEAVELLLDYEEKTGVELLILDKVIEIANRIDRDR